MQQYDVNYFIEKFEKLNNWTTEKFHDFKEENFCALGHCNYHKNDSYIEAKSLGNLFHEFFIPNLKSSGLELIPIVNDGKNIILYYKFIKGDTPKERILNVLYAIRDKETDSAIDEVNIILEESKLPIYEYS